MTKARDIADGVDTADIADGAITSAKLDTNINISGDLTVGGNEVFASGSNPWYELNETDAPTTHNRIRLYATGENFIVQSRANDNTFVSNDYTISRNSSGADQHLFRIANIEKMHIDSAGVEVTGELSATTIADVVTDIRLGTRAEQSFTTDTGVNTWYEATDGEVLTGIRIQWAFSDDVATGFYERPIQKEINGSWVTVSVV